MRVWRKNKKTKESMFVLDETEKQFIAEMNGVIFICENLYHDYEKRAVELAEAYDKKLSLIVEYIRPDIEEIFGISDTEEIQKSLGIPQVDLDRGTIMYLKYERNKRYVIGMDFDGVFDAFYNSFIEE